MLKYVKVFCFVLGFFHHKGLLSPVTVNLQPEVIPSPPSLVQIKDIVLSVACSYQLIDTNFVQKQKSFHQVTNYCQSYFFIVNFSYQSVDKGRCPFSTHGTCLIVKLFVPLQPTVLLAFKFVLSKVVLCIWAFRNISC